MSIDLGQKGRGVFYLNFRNVQDGNNQQTCRSVQEFNFGNLVEQSDNYMIAIERLIVPIQRIPYVNALVPAITFESTIGGDNFTISTPAVYSLKEFVDALNTAGRGINATFIVKITQSGIIRIDFSDLVTYNMRFNQTFADIIDIQTVVGQGDTVNNYIFGQSSVFDRFDQLHKIQVEAIGLNVTQEIINTDRTLPILTDIFVPQDYNITYNEVDGNAASNEDINILYQTRQTVVYDASTDKRFIMLRGSTPIQNITLQCVAIFKDNSRNQIIIPRRSVFECKLGFYRR